MNLTDEQTVTLRVRDKHYIRFQLNSGADCNVLPVHVYKAATGDQQLQKVESSAVSLSGFGKQNVQTVGQVLLRVWREKHIGHKRATESCVLKFELVEGEKFHSILGVKDCQKLGLIEVKDSDAINPLPADSRSESQIHTVSEMEVTKDTVKKRYPSVFQDKVGYIGDYAIKVDFPM